LFAPHKTIMATTNMPDTAFPLLLYNLFCFILVWDSLSLPLLLYQYKRNARNTE
jgi:hypothetical protein